MLLHDFQEDALIPNTELPKEKETVTKDGVEVVLRYVGTYDNREGNSLERLSRISRKIYNAPFNLVELRWEQITTLNGYWTWVKMRKKEDESVNIKKKELSLRKRR